MRPLYWAKEGLRLAGSILAATAIYTLLMSMMNGESWQDALNTGIIYFAFFGSVMAMVCNMSAYLTTIPLSLSFGCTRKEALFGMQLYRLTMLIPLVSIVGIYGSAIFYIPAWLLMTGLSGAYLLFSGLGGLLGTFTNKLSKTMVSVLSVIAVFLGMGIGGVCVVIVLVSSTVPVALVWTVLGIGVGVYILCTVFEIRAVKGFCVR